MFRHIFHDWPDKACIDILRKTVPAMDQSRSRILICEQIVHAESPSASSVLYDVDMMTLFGGKERSLSELLDLTTMADERLHVCSINTLANSATTIIELKLKHN